MSLRLPLKWAIILVIILGAILIVPSHLQGNYYGAGSGFIRWLLMSIIILAIAIWDERSAKNKK